MAKIYNTITSIAEFAFTKIIEWEKKEYDSIVRYRLVEPEMNDIPGYYLGRCYLEGIGTEREEKKGFQILANSVEAGCSRINEARELLAECYETGTGVKRNKRRAQEYRIGRAKSECLFDDLANSIRTEENDKNEI